MGTGPAVDFGVVLKLVGVKVDWLTPAFVTGSMLSIRFVIVFLISFTRLPVGDVHISSV